MMLPRAASLITSPASRNSETFTVNDVEPRELPLGWKLSPEADSAAVLYKGPFEEVTFQCGPPSERFAFLLASEE
jgi:hypothetical protein